MSRDYSPQDFATKVDWEGGIADALDYGLSADDLDDSEDAQPLKKAWAELERVYRDHYGPAVKAVEELLPEPGDEIGADIDE